MLARPIVVPKNGSMPYCEKLHKQFLNFFWVFKIGIGSVRKTKEPGCKARLEMGIAGLLYR